MPPYPLFLAQRGSQQRKPHRSYVSRVHPSNRYFTDQTGAPILPIIDHAWYLIAWGGGRSELSPGTTTPALVFQNYAANRSAAGFNAALVLCVTSDQGGDVGPFTDGRTWDGVAPWGAGGIGDLNPAYWGRIDTMLNTLADYGITVWLNVVSSNVTTTGTALASLNTTNGTTYGSALAARYASYPNIVWHFGVDYFGDQDTNYAAILTALRAGGDKHLVTVEYMPESNSRVDSGNTTTGTFGNLSSISCDDIYAYNAAYLEVEHSYQLSSPNVRPALYSDGYYDKNTTGLDVMLIDHDLWALTSGSPGWFYGSEVTWMWASTSFAHILGDPYPNTWVPKARQFWTSLPGWQNYVPDISSTFITSARGTKVTPLASGGGTVSDYTGGNNYLTGGVTPDGRLAVFYTPTSRTITFDGSKMVGSYTATWYDPYTFATTAATSSLTSYATPGTNSQGDNRWLLVLRG